VSKRLLIYCEGQTEEMVVERLIRNHLSMYGVKVERPVLAATSMNPAGQRGGFVNWEAIRFDLIGLMQIDRDPNLRVTTLLDAYAMPQAVLALAGFTAPVSEVKDIEKVERAIEQELKDPRFTAYLQRHELEALLLADCDALARVFHRHQSGLAQLRDAIAGFGNTEDINHGATTHPSARLADAVEGYEYLKASNAYFVLAEAGFEVVRRKCPRFDAWMTHWEQWGVQR